jgi:hypothetical protein
MTYCNGTDVFVLSGQRLAHPTQQYSCLQLCFIFGHAIIIGTNVFALTLAFVLFCGRTCGSMEQIVYD